MDSESNPVIDVSISYGFGEGNRYTLDNIPHKIQLALYKYDLFMDMKEDIVKSINRKHTHVKVVHLPLDTLRRSFSDIIALINFCYNEFGCMKYVVHPNKLIEGFIYNFLQWETEGIQLLLETFPYRNKKAIRSPLNIMEWCIQYPSSLKMVIDTSHIEEVWMNYMIMGTLLKYTSVIHLSNQSKEKAIGKHLPFNHSKGMFNLVGFVRDLRYRYKWEGDLVLEYMPEHKHKLIKNRDYIERLLA
jgi:hypothetical protein